MYLKNLLKRIKIAAYHSILDDPQDPYAVSIDNFRSQMKWIADNGYIVISLKDALKLLNGNLISARHIVLTFDDGFVDFLENAADILEKHNFETTVFVVASNAGSISDWRAHNLNRQLMGWSQLREILNRGHSIGSHGLHHYDLTTLNQKELHEEIFASKDIIQEQLGLEVDSFSYPWGKCTQRESSSVEKAGYSCAVGVGRYRNNIFGYSRFLLGRILIEKKDTISDFVEKLK